MNLSPKPSPDVEMHVTDDEQDQGDVNSLEYYIPTNIPPEVLAYDAHLDQLAVGRAGKLGALILRLEKDKENGRTMVKRQFSKVPLYTQRALYLEESLPSMAYMYVISPSGGILQGDRYRMDITLRNEAMAHITTQGATRVYRMEKNFATQIVNFNVGERCYFEYVPDQIIPYRDSRFYQIANLNVHDAATLVYSEMITPGRVAMGEHFEYDICYMKAIGKNQKGNYRFYDVAILEPKKRNMGVFGIMGKSDVFGTVYIVTERKYVSDLNEMINHQLKDTMSEIITAGGTTILPENGGILVRLLGDTASNIRTALFEVVRSVRRVVLNAPFSGIRKG